MSDDAATARAAVAQFVALAEQTALLAAAICRVRTALSDISPGAARHSGFTGSAEQLESAVADAYGFHEFELARRKLIDALRDPLDDLDT